MRTLIAATILALASTTATASNYMSAQCPRGIVSQGANLAKVRDACGQPDRIVQLQNRLGAAMGERWEFTVGRRTLLLTISGGRVQGIDWA
jgi:hypothetical protein